jgi:hypothetical protein
VKAAETVSADMRGHDAGKKISGRKRHVVVDAKEMIVAAMVTPANVTERAAATIARPGTPKPWPIGQTIS